MWAVLFRTLLKLLSRGGSTAVRVARSGRIAFTGLIRNRPLRELTHQEVRNALSKAGMREAHNAHFVKRLLERGPRFGINTLDDFARAFNSGVASAGRDGTTIVRLSGSQARVVLSRQGHFISLSGP